MSFPGVQNANLTEFNALREAAVNEAYRAVDRERRRRPSRYWPSKMNQAALDHLNEVFLAAWPEAIEKRIPQLARLNKKLARSEPGWVERTEDELRAPPATLWRGAKLSS
jgi:uncharacterized coiled-coil protein SlyX